MEKMTAVFKKELVSFFSSPVAFVFFGAYLLMLIYWRVFTGAYFLVVIFRCLFFGGYFLVLVFLCLFLFFDPSVPGWRPSVQSLSVQSGPPGEPDF